MWQLIFSQSLQPTQKKKKRHLLFWLPLSFGFSLSKNKHLSPSLVPVGLNFSVSKCTTMTAMYIVILISYTVWTQRIEKRTYISSKVVPAGLNFLFGKATTLVAMQIFKIFHRITHNKVYQSWILIIGQQ